MEKRMNGDHKDSFLKRLFQGKTDTRSVPVVAEPAAISLTWEEKEAVKETYTSGSEYFLFAGDIDPDRHQLVILLKAFSQFKKWQRSDMKLVIAGSITKRTKRLTEKLETYKYKQDVLLIPDPAPSAVLRLIAAAYVFIYTDSKDRFSANILNAFQSQTPVIASETPEIARMAGERALLITPGSEEELAANMLRLYKDEAFRATFLPKPS